MPLKAQRHLRPPARRRERRMPQERSEPTSGRATVPFPPFLRSARTYTIHIDLTPWRTAAEATGDAAPVQTERVVAAEPSSPPVR
ncbi:hypothetical protein GCM10027416_04100 [Okibacterium endophyticum]